jgi:hypothetical protein
MSWMKTPSTSSGFYTASETFNAFSSVNGPLLTFSAEKWGFPGTTGFGKNYRIHERSDLPR